MSRKKKLLLQIVLIISLFFSGFTIIAYVQYDLSPLEYIKYSMPLTTEEKEYLKNKDTLVYGMDWKAPPLTFTNEATDQNEGLLIDYMSSLSIELGVNVVYKATPFNEIMDALDSEEIDMSDLFESSQRLKKYAFTQSIYSLRAIAVTDVRRQDLQTTDEIRGKRIALVEDDFVVEYFKSTYPEGEDGTEYVIVEDIKEGLYLLCENKIDILAGDETVINYYAKELDVKDSIREVGDGLYEKNVTFAVRKEDTILLSVLNKGILNLKKNNILIQAQNKWFDNAAPIITDIKAMRWIPLVFAGILIVFVCFLYWQSIMDRKIRERTHEIQVQKDNQRTIIDNIQSMLIVMNSDGYIIDANQAAVNVFSSEENKGYLIGKTASALPLLDVLLREHEKNPSSKIHSIQDKYYVVFTSQLNSFDNSRLIVVEDYTEKTLTEIRLRQESKMSAVGQLSAGLAHEIRNPLGLIKNYTYILKYGVEGLEDNPELSHAINVIGDSTDRINGLIENLLKFSRLGDGEMKEIDVYELIRNIEALERKKMEGLQIKFYLDYQGKRTFYTNEETLKITFINLINNAVDSLAYDESSNAEKEIFCQITVEDKELRVKIQDNGPGVAKEHQESLFMPFFTTKGNGTGLGLYTVNSEIDKLGGTIQLDREYENGASFVVRIPAMREVD